MGGWQDDLEGSPKEKVQSMINALAGKEDDWNVSQQ